MNHGLAREECRKKLNPLKNQSDILQEELKSYDKTYGKAANDTVFDQNRGLETSLKGKNIKKLSTFNVDLFIFCV